MHGLEIGSAHTFEVVLVIGIESSLCEGFAVTDLNRLSHKMELLENKV